MINNSDASELSNNIGENELSDEPQFDTFLFDLDGTILDTLPDLVVLTNRTLREEGYPEHTQDEIKGYVGNGARALMYQAVPQDVGEAAAEAAYQRWMALFSDYDNSLTNPYPDIVPTLQELKERGCALGVVSNKFDEGVAQVIGQRVPGLFDLAYGVRDEIPRKPDPAGVFRAIEDLGGTVERTAYVGDSPGDVRTARNAGVFAIGVTWGYHDAEDFTCADAVPDLMISSPRELLILNRVART